MNDFIIGLIVTAVVIGICEVFTYLEKRLIGALTLMGIPFIYIGFSWHDLPSLFLCIGGVAVFFTLAYFGYKRNFILIPIGLVLHGVWDFLFPLFSTSAPEGYDIFCFTIDILLAVYFYFRVKTLKVVGD